mmetsp:Transcript_11323/g.34937  ORF Transcript_11323/g.34937 Transcript_11323/m.34937 type:complete len:276 (+) Transcript_11323:320-1147(+)
MQTAKLSKHETWSPEVLAEIERAFAEVEPSLPRSVSDDAPIYNFMVKECDFALEHADGSFMDHLHFCSDYSSLHFSQHSPRVLLLHSICGVGTNCFPMKREKLPMLRSLLQAEECAHIEAFPSVLRLMIGTPFLAELCAAPNESLLEIKSLTMHRVLDNERITLNADQLWDQLNYHLIHTLDFLPLTSWQATFNEFMAHFFVTLYELLTRVGKLEARVDYKAVWAKPLQPGSRPATCGAWVVDRLPQSVALRFARTAVAQYSADIGHSLNYTIGW